MNGEQLTQTDEKNPVTRGADPRIKALRRFALSISALTVLGHTVLGFEQAPITPIICVVVAVVFDAVLESLAARSEGRRPAFAVRNMRAVVDYFLPALISALACAMLLYANANLMPYVLATMIAIGSKYVFKVRVNGKWRHYLNPSNFGIAAVLLLLPSVGIAPPYQFTANVTGPVDWLLPMAIIVLGTMLNTKLTGRWPLILGWVLGFVAQAVLRTILTDASLVASLAPMTGVAFILFTNYMITDPATTPTGRRAQLAFGITTATIYGVLVTLGISFGLFFALVITCGLRGAGIVLLGQRERFATFGSRTRRLVMGPGTSPQPLAERNSAQGALAVAELSAPRSGQ
ncbi:enediyne biosynthesis protein UnbU [Agromyces intestinalis]|uniref:enediyne biosynthesis protein UnbU n=1 Tax=Agromyces intestinalis TaxID=2592652 RepID=UPI001AEF9343|nr:enediyne biosynthesis protein UnbU [Agromyces intestinalis]